MGIDALGVDWWYDLQPYAWGCDCPARGDDMLLHTETCSVTPIYADLVMDCDDGAMPREILSEIHWARVSMTQTVINCAECGRGLLARDADVIYRAPISVIPGITLDSRLPDDIVKAVCPEHNHKGRIGYQRQAGAGY